MTPYLYLLPPVEKAGLRNRRVIFETVSNDPGLHFRELSRRTGIPQTTLRHHLDKLERAELISVQKDGGETRYFPRERVSERMRKVFPLLRKEVPRGIVLLLLMKPECTPSEMASMFTLSPSTISYYLKKLQERSIISCEPRGRNMHYCVVDEDELVGFFVVYRKTFSDELLDRMLRRRYDRDSKKRV